MDETENKKIKNQPKKNNKINSNNSCFNKCCSKISITIQFIIFFIPVLFIFIFIMILNHVYLLAEVLKFDFYAAIKEELLKYFLTDLDDINNDLNKKKVSLAFEDISNLAFFKIYFEELSKYGLLNKNQKKIFPNISSIDENIYKTLEKDNTLFSIPKEMSEKYIDSRNDSLSELAKLYFYFYPMIASEASSANTFIKQTYLIAYEVDDNNDIKGDPLYFNFPRIRDDFIKNDNFHPYNNLISPRIAGNENCNKYDAYNSNEGNLKLNKIFRHNWFIHFDCKFRTQIFNDFYMKNFHLNENNKGGISKTNVVTMHTNLYNNESKKFIVDIIFFIKQSELKSEQFDDSVFIISNFSLHNRKYSDNQTFVLNDNDIVEVALTSQIEQYFHYGLSSQDDSFYSEGSFYDNIDLNKFSEPEKYYKSIKGFYFDIRYFSSFYLYAKLFETSFYTKEFMYVDNIYYYIFNSTKQIKEICSKFDFSLYTNSLEENNIDCFNEKNLLYYSKENIDTSFSEGLTLPECVCLPLYCIKNLKNGIDFENIEFVDEILLPEKCQNNLLYYQNSFSENYTANVDKDKLDKIYLRYGESLKDQVENQFIKFSHEKKELNGGLNYIMFSIIDNDSMKSIIINFVKDLNYISNVFLLIIIFGIILVFVVIFIRIIIYIHSISNIIHDFINKMYSFLRKTSNNKNKEEMIKASDENSFVKEENDDNKFPLLSRDNLDEKNDDENELINDLYQIYFKFYKLKEKNSNEISEKERNSEKINNLRKSNELFQLFLEFTLHISKFKFNINIDYDFYKNSKLMKNFLKEFSNKSLSNEDKEQILYTKSIIKELLSTELVDDYGFITNLNFNYITNINLNKTGINNNYIQSAIFKRVEEMIKNKNDENLNIDDIKIVFKNKNIIMKIIEEKFEQDDYLNLPKLESAFNNTLINSFYNYIKRIVANKAN